MNPPSGASRRERLARRMDERLVDELLERFRSSVHVLDQLLDAGDLLTIETPPSNLRPALRRLFASHTIGVSCGEVTWDTRTTPLAGVRGVAEADADVVGFAVPGGHVAIDLVTSPEGRYTLTATFLGASQPVDEVVWLYGRGAPRRLHRIDPQTFRVADLNRGACTLTYTHGAGPVRVELDL